MSESETSKINKKYNLILGRHCLVKSPDFLLGAVQEALKYRANSLMVYSGAPQNSFRRPLTELKITEFKKKLVANNIDINNVVVYGPYILNLANTLDENKFQWSVEFLKKEVARMEEIGLKTIVLHPGSALSADPKKALAQVAKGLNLVLNESSNIKIALETMCQRGGEVGGTFEQLRYIIDRVEKKERIVVCWDTCHLYSVGYDIRNNLEGVIKEFEEKIGLDKLRVIHVNDSVFEIGENKDRHENIGYGKIGLEALKKIVWHPKFNGVIKILETPRKKECYREEIKALKKID
jgi:deoxyribonuclease IV